MALFPPYEPANMNHAGRPIECPTCGGGIVVITGGGILGMLATNVWLWFKERRLHRRTLRDLRQEACEPEANPSGLPDLVHAEGAPSVKQQGSADGRLRTGVINRDDESEPSAHEAEVS